MICESGFKHEVIQANIMSAFSQILNKESLLLIWLVFSFIFLKQKRCPCIPFLPRL